MCVLAGMVALQGVRYTHRSNFLHALITIGPDGLALSATSTVLMVVPMFHANSWGLNFSGERVKSTLLEMQKDGNRQQILWYQHAGMLQV